MNVTDKITDEMGRALVAKYREFHPGGGWPSLAEAKDLLRAALSASQDGPQCCMCGKKGLSTVEGDGGTECELTDGRWVCSAGCWERAVEPAGVEHEVHAKLREIVARNPEDFAEPYEPAGVEVETDKMRRALELLIRCGEKQGWNDAYEQEMAFARAALKGDKQ